MSKHFQRNFASPNIEREKTTHAQQCTHTNATKSSIISSFVCVYLCVCKHVQVPNFKSLRSLQIFGKKFMSTVLKSRVYN